MPTEEGKQVLRLLAEGKIDTEQAYRLLRALGDIDDGAKPPPPPPPPPHPGHPGARGRILRIRVTEGSEQKVNVAILCPSRASEMKWRERLVRVTFEIGSILASARSSFKRPHSRYRDDEDRVETSSRGLADAHGRRAGGPGVGLIKEFEKGRRTMAGLRGAPRTSA